MDELLRGVIDFHVHSAPDIVPRSVDDLQLAHQATEAGMHGFVIKSHYEPTASRAAILNRLFPETTAYGSTTLNSSVGGINPMAVEHAALNGARVIWFPTFDSVSQLPHEMERPASPVFMQRNVVKHGAALPTVAVLDASGKIRQEVNTVLELIAEHDLVLCSGHISPKESFQLFRAAKELGVKRMVLTHSDCILHHYTIEEQEQYVRLGVMIEHSYVNVLFGAIQWGEVCHEIRAVGVENVLYSSDMGQKQFVSPVDGLKECMERLLASGFTENELDRIFRKNPEALLKQ